MKEIILRTENITKSYGVQNAVENICIEITRGEIYGLIGLNGAGKTTFMKAITGLIGIDNGKIELFASSNEQELRLNRRRIGQIIEYPAIYPSMTAWENVEYQRILSGVPDGRKSHEVLKTVGLSQTGVKKTKDFSLGMKQRLGLAMALVNNPEFLILDEPVNGLDPQGIIEFRLFIRKLVDEFGLTVLISSHLLDELTHLATRYGILHKGRLVKQLSSEELSHESRQYLSIQTNDSSKSLAILQEHFNIRDFTVSPSNELHIMEGLLDAGKMNTLLVQNGIEVKGLHIREQKLEEYFIHLIQEERQ